MPTLIKDTNEHNAKREKQKQTRQVRIVMGVLAFICLSFGTRGFIRSLNEKRGRVFMIAEMKRSSNINSLVIFILFKILILLIIF